MKTQQPNLIIPVPSANAPVEDISNVDALNIISDLNYKKVFNIWRDQLKGKEILIRWTFHDGESLINSALDGNLKSICALCYMSFSECYLSLEEEFVFAVMQKYSKANSVYANYILFLCFKKMGSYKEAYRYLRIISDAEYSPAIYQIGLFLEKNYVSSDDHAKAYYYYKKCASNGHFFGRKKIAKDLICKGNIYKGSKEYLLAYTDRFLAKDRAADKYW